MNTAVKQAGIAIIQTGGSHSNTAQRLSTATRTSAERAWMGGPSADGGGAGIFGGSEGRTSTGTSLAATSLIFGGLSMSTLHAGYLPLTSKQSMLPTALRQ